jgi:hypothetical protein
MTVHDAGGMEDRLGDRRPDERESARLEGLREGRGVLEGPEPAHDASDLMA